MSPSLLLLKVLWPHPSRELLPGRAAGGDARQGMCSSSPGEEAGFGALVLRPGLENGQPGPFLFGEGCGRGRRAPQKGDDEGANERERTCRCGVSAYETNPESGMFSHPGGPGTQKERGMLARWDLWADTGLRN